MSHPAPTLIPVHIEDADTVLRGSRGCDTAKRINGRKRFIVTDILGLLLVVCAVTVSVQDRDGAGNTLWSLYLCTPARFVFADAGFAGALVAWTRRLLATVVHIVRKAPRQAGFVVVPSRWVVERSPVWLTAHRRLARGRDAVRQ